MIDITNEVFTKIKTELTPIRCSQPFVGKPASFPCVTFEEIINNTDVERVDNGGEFTAIMAFEVVIYTTGAKATSEMRSIRNKIDGILSNLNMNRSLSQTIDNYLDLNIKRHVLRYDCVVDKNNKIYRG